MAIIVQTLQPKVLADALIHRINNKLIKTWSVDGENDITITNPRWKFKAWFSIHEELNKVIFGLVPSSRYIMTKEIYGVYHGRLSATLLANFDDLIEDIMLTSGYWERYDVIPK